MYNHANKLPITTWSGFSPYHTRRSYGNQSQIKFVESLTAPGAYLIPDWLTEL